MKNPKVMPVMTNNMHVIEMEQTVDEVAEAYAALQAYGGMAELKRRGHTYDDYMNGKIPGFTPEELIARYEAEEAWRG